MSICYSFLIGDSVHQSDVWSNYFDGSETILVHSYKVAEAVSLPFKYQLVTQVPTSWEKTLEAHFSLYEYFLKTDCEYFVLLSESCIPLAPKSHIESKILNGGDKWTWLEGHPTKKYKRFWNRKNEFRSTYHIHDIKSAEQWYILKRSTIEVLYAHKEDILHELRNSFADNEMLLTYAHRYIKNYTFEEGRHWLIDWSGSNSRRHPRIFDEVVQAKYYNTEHLFLRKVDKNTILHQMKDFDKRIAVHMHIYYPKIAREVLLKWHERFKLPFDLYITHSCPLNKIQKRWLEFPNVHFEPVENKGYDIFPFLELTDKWLEYDYVVKLHTKKNRSWRNQLYYPLLKVNPDTLSSLPNDKPAMILPEKWAAREEWGNTKDIQYLCNHWGMEYTPNTSFSAGTMFIVNNAYLQNLYAGYATLDKTKFDHSVSKKDGTFSHGFERFFGHLVDDTYKIKVK